MKVRVTFEPLVVEVPKDYLDTREDVIDYLKAQVLKPEIEDVEPVPVSDRDPHRDE